MSKKLQQKIKKVALEAFLQAIKEEAKFEEQRIKQNAQKLGLKDTGTLLRSIKAKVNKNKIVVTMESYGHILDSGYKTKTGKLVKKPFISGDKELKPDKITARVEKAVKKIIKRKL